MLYQRRQLGHFFAAACFCHDIRQTIVFKAMHVGTNFGLLGTKFDFNLRKPLLVQDDPLYIGPQGWVVGRIG